MECAKTLRILYVPALDCQVCALADVDSSFRQDGNGEGKLATTCDGTYFFGVNSPRDGPKDCLWHRLRDAIGAGEGALCGGPEISFCKCGACQGGGATPYTRYMERQWGRGMAS